MYKSKANQCTTPIGHHKKSSPLFVKKNREGTHRDGEEGRHLYSGRDKTLQELMDSEMMKDYVLQNRPKL